MKIVLLIKQVPETHTVRMDEKTGMVIRYASEAIVNPLDLHATEAGLLLKELMGGELIAISMGPPSAETALREVAAMGADRAILVSDRAYAGSDTYATSFILSSAIRSEAFDFDLILCGERATDGETGQVGPETAAALGIPVVTGVTRIVPEAERSVRVWRMTEEGTQIIRVKCPVLLTVNKCISHPRLPTLSGKIRAKASELKTLTQRELKLPVTRIGLSGSPTEIVRVFRSQWSRSGEIKRAVDLESTTAAIASLCLMLERKGLK